MAFVIERDIPLAKITGTGARTGTRESKYPLGEMDVGDSFLLSEGTVKTASHIVVAGNKRFPDRKFASRTVEGGVRVWRVA